jgi:hypothetical protein
MADYIGATPQNPLLGLLYGGYDYLRSPQRTQQMQGLASLLESTGLPKTIERMSYGEPLTNIGQANVPLLKPETAEAMMTVAPMAVPVARGAGRLVGSQINRAMLGEGGLLAPITPQPMFAVSPINLKKGIYKPELTMEEMLKVKDIPTVDRVKQSIDLVGEKEFKKMVDAQYKKYKPTDQDQEAMLVESVTLDILGKAQRSPIEYPLAPAGTRYEEFAGNLTYMTPDEFLQKVRPLKLDDESLDNIAALKRHIESGGKLDPLHIYSTGKEDGRHRAYLAKELGIEKVPVALHEQPIQGLLD